MKKHLLKIIFFFFLFFLTLPQVFADVTKTVGSGGHYATLKQAFDAINAGTIKNGVITLQIISNTTETASAVLNNSGSGNARYTSVNIYPTGSGYTISGSFNASLIELKGADNVTIDGRVNQSGAANLSLINTNASVTSPRTLNFTNDATNNIVKYSYLKSSCTGSTGAVVYFGTTNGTSGNDNNTIENCNITNSGTRPTNAIYSQGTSGKDNSGNIISNNNIYDFFGITASSNGIYVGNYSTAWTITGNSFYETTTLVPTGAWTYRVIILNNTSGNSFIISDNYIGGTSPRCGGSALIVSSATAHLFQGIYLNVGTTTATSIQNNTFRNIRYSGTQTTPWQGINVTAGAVNIGTVTGNTIGAATGTDSISVYGQANNTNVYGIYLAGTGIVNCQNNLIGSITTTNLTSSYATNFYGIYKNNSAGTVNINNNTIGSAITANSIECISTSTSSDQTVMGIYSNGTGTTSISNNTIANIKNSGTSSNAVLTNGAVGIGTYSGSNTITANSVHDIVSANYVTAGIVQGSITKSTVQAVNNNSLFNLSNTNTSAAVGVYGIASDAYRSGASTLSQNFIHSFSIASSDNTSVMNGIDLISGSVTCSNNIINLGVGITNNHEIIGIRENGIVGQINYVYFNSVYIAGNPSGVTANTYAYFTSSNKGETDIRNNIFVNVRSGGTTGKHYVIKLPGLAKLTLDYNDYYFSGTGTLLGNLATVDKADLTAWKAATTKDINSLSVNPDFISAGGQSVFDYYTAASLPAVTGTGVTVDYSGVGRGATPKMGALETNDFVWQGGTSTDFGTPANWIGGVVPPDGANITFAVNPDRSCLLDQNRILGNIVNSQATDKLDLNRKQLTITKKLILTNGALLDATGVSSTVVFGGFVAQNIPSGAFVNNSAYALNIDNVNGLTLNGDFTVTQTLTLTNGALFIGTNTLTLNGAIVTSTGNLTGGSSANIVIGGSSSSGTTLPAVSLNNLTLNRNLGLSLGGNLDIAGTLTLTNGTLTVGANTLTISGNSPVRTTGTIDAGNAGSTLFFGNVAAITLPSSIFSTAVNNLTLNSTGGVTASSDFTVNGILNLQSANPSSTKGKLDMWDGSAVRTLTMGVNATTTGVGDVTGIVKRQHAFNNSLQYSFGSQNTTLTFLGIGTMPTEVSCKIVIGTAPAWRATALKRYYTFSQSGGTDRVIVNLSYLDSESDAGETDETKLVLWDAHGGSPWNSTIEPHGKSNNDLTNNWIGLSGSTINYIAQSVLDNKQWGLSYDTSTKNRWLGADNTYPTKWDVTTNWSGGHVPLSTEDVLIPAACPAYPVLTLNIALNSIEIETGASVDANSMTIAINGYTGAWQNYGTFIPGTGTVVFAHANSSHVISMTGTTNFFNIQVGATGWLEPSSGTNLNVSGAIDIVGGGKFDCTNTNNTVNYNGTAQTIVNPNGAISGYHNLILSGSGTKTLPASALSVLGNFNLSGTVSATAASALTILGTINIGVGTTFTTGNFNHTLGGDFDNNGTFNITPGNTMTMNGSLAQSVFGTFTSSFYNLDINNINGVSLFVNENVTNVLTLSAGNLTIGSNTLGINGSIIKTNGFLNLNVFSSMSIGGSAALEFPADLFSAAPSLNNLTINRPGGVTLGNQNVTVNGLLELVSGTLTIGANAFTLTGLPPSKTSGNIDAGNAGATLNLSCTSAVILPATLFTGGVNNLTINVTDGVSVVSDLTVNGILNLQSANPIATKGSLDMWDGSAIKTLTMGANATTVGVGDVSGIVKRTTINSGIAYTYGNEFTTIYFTEDGTLPTEMSAKIKIGTTPSWRTGGINREMEIIQTGGGGTKARVQYHYLDSEVNDNDESRLVFWVGDAASSTEFGRSAYNSIDNWINLSNVNVAFFSSSWNGTKNITLDTYSILTTLTWNGSVSDSWTTPDNWTPVIGPSSEMNIIIPDASTTPHAPSLPAFTEIKSITLDAAGVLNTNVDAQLTINGTSAWINYGGTLNPGTSTVIFKNAAATISGTTNFNNITINDSSEVRITSGGILRIAGTLNNIGILRAVIIGETTTVEYNGTGDQTVIIPNVATSRYHNLILSGSGVKTMPVSGLEVYGNFTVSGAVTVNANDTLTIKGNMNVGAGSTFNTGLYHHFIAGNIENDGTITTATDGTSTLNGTATQTISGTGITSFNNLAIENASSGSVQINNNVNAYSLSIAADSKMTINSLAKMNVTGSITNNAGISGLLIKASESAANGTLIFTGTAPLATVEMFSKANWNLLNPVGAKYKWQFFGIPVSTLVASPAFDGAYVRRHDETGVSTKWIQLSNQSTLEPFNGYEVTQEMPKIYSFEGTLVNADYNRTLVTTSGAKYPGQYIFSNPYTAAIDITKITFGTQTEASVYLYNCGSQQDWTDNLGGSTDGSSPGQYTVAPKLTAGTGGIPGQIPSMQGFLVFAKSSSELATFGIPYSSVAMKNTDKQRAPSVEMAAIPQKVFTRVEVIGSRFSDRMWIFSEPTCTRGFDNGWDGYKFLGSGLTPQLYAMEADGNYQVNAVDDINNTELGFKAGEDSLYTLKVTNEYLNNRYSELYLLDLKEHITTDISKSGTEYSFIAQPTATPVKRFKIFTSLSMLNAIETQKSLKSQLKIFSSLQNIIIQNQSEAPGELMLYDITGRCFQKMPFNAKTITTIPMDLPAGIYLAKGLTVDEEVSERLIFR